VAFPPIDKSFLGVQQDFGTRLTLVERRLAIGGSSGGGGGSGGTTYISDWNEAITDGNYWGNAAANQPVLITSGGADYWVGTVQTLVGNDGTNRILQTLMRPDVALSPVYQRTFNRGANGIWDPWRAEEKGSGNSTALGTTDLDLIVQAGTYYQSSVTNGTLARNYPQEGTAGILEVLTGIIEVPASTQVVQRFTARGGQGNQVWTRAKYGTGAWQEWVELSSNSHYHLARTSAQAIPNQTWTSLLWNSTVHKVGNISWDGTGNFTIDVSGVYMVHAYVRYVSQTTAVGQRILSLLVDGSSRLEGVAGNASLSGVTTGEDFHNSAFYTAGTTLAIQTYQSSGVTLNTVGGEQYTRCQIDRIA
jgi:hypothetical protein